MDTLHIILTVNGQITIDSEVVVEKFNIDMHNEFLDHGINDDLRFEKTRHHSISIAYTEVKPESSEG